MWTDIKIIFFRFRGVVRPHSPYQSKKMDSLDEVINAVSELLYVFEQAQSDLNTDIVVDLRNLDALNQAIEIMVGEVRKNT